MAYLTSSELKAAVGGEQEYVLLTDDDGDQIADPGVADFLLAQVDEIVNGFARRGAYTVPLAVADIAAVIPFLLDIANYKARTRGGRQATDDDRHKYDDAMRIMEEIANGTYKLPSFTETERLAGFEINSYAQLFSRGTLGNM